MTATATQQELMNRCLQAIAFEPQKPTPHLALARLQLETGNIFAAKTSAQEALRLAPTYAEAWVVLGQVAEKLRDVTLAGEAYGKAADLTPLYAEPRQQLAKLNQSMTRPAFQVRDWPTPENVPPTDDWTLDGTDDESTLRRLIAAEGFAPKRLVKLALNLLMDGRAVEAACFAHYVLKYDPKNANALLALAALAEVDGDREAARKFAVQASDNMPTHPIAAVQAMTTLLEVCAWDRFTVLRDRVTAAVAANPGSAEPLASLYFLSDPNVIAAVGAAWGNKVAGMALAGHTELPTFERPVSPDGRITIGYMSADFHRHPIGLLIAELLHHHARDRFIIRAYSLWPADEDEVRAAVKRNCDSFTELYGMDALAAAQTIARDGVDILVDLTGYTLNNRADILAFKPAPLQVNYAGYLGTMGVPFMDYQIVDATVAADPDQLAASESLVRLPHSLLAGDRHRFSKPVTPMTRAEAGLPATSTVFCNFSHVTRLNPETFQVWMRILKRVPGSILWLIQRSAETRQRILTEAVTNGISSSRIVFAERADFDTYLRRLAVADVFLDTLPHNAGAVAINALWVGLPVLTCPGRAFQSRIGAGMARAAGVPDMVVDTLAAYEDMAVRLGTAPDEVAAIKRRLAANRDTHPMFDPALMTKHLEWAYHAMWQRHVQGLPPAMIDVPAKI